MYRIVFFGTSEFALPALKGLHESDLVEIVAVVTQPDKPAGRKQLPLPSPVKLWAIKHGLKVSQPESLKIRNWKLEIPEADLYVVAAYGKIIGGEILDIPRLGVLNIHPSLLPKYRGPSPIQTAILNGDKETGVTIMLMDEEVDHGALIASSKVEIQNPKVSYQDLHDELAGLGAELLMKVLPKFIEGTIRPTEQDHSQATFTKVIEKDDGRIDWTQNAENIDRQVRAFHVWPVAWTTLEGKRLKIYSSIPHSDARSKDSKPGEISISDNKIFVECGRGRLGVERLQLEGGRALDSLEFLNGHKDLENKVLE